MTDFSEPGGYFRSDNFVSNETTFQYVIPTLQQTTAPAACTSASGPIRTSRTSWRCKPTIAFIVDIRRQNMLQHLMYKALIEMSPTRAEFLSRLFSRPKPGRI